ncbi:MAG: RNA polymerase sigma factor [Planctomycetota bacterium]|nr:RNA polymerase sigma factor [Planctomycetota bacterium]
MPMDEADRLLVNRIRQGDAGSWEELIARYEGRLMAFVSRRLRDRTAAEDVVQEAFMGFLISLPNYDDRTPLDTFLFTITAYKLTDCLRKSGRRPTLPLLMHTASSGASAEPAGRARRASSLVRSGESRAAEEHLIRECLAELIAGWRERGEYERWKCIELLFVAGWSNKDVASRLDISEQAVANHKYFVVSKLKQAAEQKRFRNFDPAEFGME